MRFWKFEYEGPEALFQCIEKRSLPSGQHNVPGLRNTYEHPLKSMKSDDGLILAKLDGDQGRIFAVGKIRSIGKDGHAAVVDWKATQTTVFPDAKGGLVNWQTKSAFEISPEPAKRYGLNKLVEYYVCNAA